MDGKALEIASRYGPYAWGRSPGRKRADSEGSAGPAGRTARLSWVLAGHVCVGLGLVGAVLPLMPTTVFVLCAAACYARGSERFYRKLLEHRVFGPVVRDWQRNRAMSAKAKRWAVSAIVITISLSMIALQTTALRAVLAAVALILVVALLRIPTIQAPVSARG